MTDSTTHRPLVLIVRDGWGRNPDAKWNNSNAVVLAKHPVADALLRDYPSTLIHTSGFDVGLPEGTMGNSEVGHQNIGAGRVVDQESVAITKQIRNGEFNENATLNDAVDRAMKTNKNFHLFGIASDAGVHGLLEHLYGCLEFCRKKGLGHKGIDRVFLHAFTDGRDTSPNSGLGFIRQIEAKMRSIGVGRFSTVSGRYWAMDRDNRWSRVEKAFRAIALGEGPRFESAEQAVQSYYDHPTAPNLTGDEFITPSVIDGGASVADGDSVLFYNYRGDRPRELTKAFVLPQFGPPFDGFDRGKMLDLYFATMTAYEQDLPVHVAYPKPPKMKSILGEFVSSLGLKQFRCAETEKYPHVTFFFNDYRDEPFPGEDRAIIPSDKTVSTYDQKPEMSAPGVRDETLRRIASQQYALLVVNFANADMVGHTGVLSAAVKAVEIVDECVGEIIAAIKKVGGTALVLADHGNAEQMVDPLTGGPHTAHTVYDVEIVAIDDRLKGQSLRTGGRLADVAPTALAMMGYAKPPEMSGQSLIS